jgi:hypothetical protein
VGGSSGRFAPVCTVMVAQIAVVVSPWRLNPASDALACQAATQGVRLH